MRFKQPGLSFSVGKGRPTGDEVLRPPVCRRLPAHHSPACVRSGRTSNDRSTISLSTRGRLCAPLFDRVLLRRSERRLRRSTGFEQPLRIAAQLAALDERGRLAGSCRPTPLKLRCVPARSSDAAPSTAGRRGIRAAGMRTPMHGVNSPFESRHSGAAAGAVANGATSNASDNAARMIRMAGSR